MPNFRAHQRFRIATIVVPLFLLSLGACSGDPASSNDQQNDNAQFDVGQGGENSGENNGENSGENGNSTNQNGGDADVGGFVDTANGTNGSGNDNDDVQQPDTGTANQNANNGEPESLYVGSTDPYAMGPLSVSEQLIDDAPKPLLVFAPTEAGHYPTVVFQHGFLMANSYYSQLLQYLASHGFVVVAPQMYGPGGLPIGAPSTEEEAQDANEVYDWIDTEIDGYVDVTARTDHLGLAGHSRGAKVIWWALDESPRTVDAVAGVDPVDGDAGPLGGEPRVLDDPVDIEAPVLIIGAGLGSESTGGFGQACAPEGDNYDAFFDASTAPAWLVVAPEYGHLDMMDDDLSQCGFECDACVDGESRAPMRELSAAMLVALYRGGLQGDESSFDLLSDEGAAPILVDMDAH